MTGDDTTSPLAVWCEREQDRAEQECPQRRGEVLVNVAAALLTRLAAEHGADELGVAAGSVAAALGDYVGDDVLVAALGSWQTVVPSANSAGEDVDGEQAHGLGPIVLTRADYLHPDVADDDVFAKQDDEDEPDGDGGFILGPDDFR